MAMCTPPYQQGRKHRGEPHGLPQGEQKIDLKNGIQSNRYFKRGAARSRKITNGMEVRNSHLPLPDKHPEDPSSLNQEL